MVIGIMIILYPIISNIIASYTQTVVIENYRGTVELMTDEDIEAEREKAREYNDSISDSSNVSIQLDDNGDTDEENTGVSYYNALNVGEVIGYINIPKINVYLPIYHGTSESVLQSGVGHVENTSLPIGEKSTHAVLAGHTGLIRTKMFDDLTEMEIGDKFYLYILNEEYAYQVDQIKVVLPDNNEYVAVVDGEEYVTLLTCTPYGVNTHRLLVRGTRIELDSEEIENLVLIDDTSTSTSKDILFKGIIIVTISSLGLVILVIILVVAKKKYKAKRRK